jgi:ankyrin repeat protein
LLSLGGTGQQRYELARLLIERGAHLNYRQQDQGWTPLTHALSHTEEALDLVRLLLDRGADVESPMNDGLTALHLAVRFGHERIVQELVSRGARLDVRTRPDPNEVSLSPPFDQMWERSREERERTFEPGYRDSGRTVVFELALAWNPKIARILRESGADFLATDDNGWTGLHLAANMGAVEAMDRLLDLGLDPNAASNRGYRPLHVAMHGGIIMPSGEAVRLLLSRGANPKLKNEAGQTPVELLRDGARRFLHRQSREPVLANPELLQA